MNKIALEFDGVWKKFQRGEKHDSLRDLIPSLFANTLRGKICELKDKEFWALRDVSFQVARGEALGIIGPNGSGKSTTLKILTGILRPTTGQMRVNGRMSALIEVGAGFHPDLTGRENIYLNGAILGMKKKEIDRKLDEIIEFSGIEEFIDTPVKRYSSGMYARLGFSIAAHVDPDILLVDEVLSVGDFTFQGKCIEKMHQILRNGTTVIFVSHHMDAVATLCDRALLLVKGEVNLVDKPKKVIDEYYATGSQWLPQCVDDAKIKILEKNITCESNNLLSLVQGDLLQVEIKLVAQENCTISPGLFLLARGQVVFDTTLGIISGKRINLINGDIITIHWDFRLNLPPGVYRIGTHIEEKLNSYHYYNNQEATITVCQNKRYAGNYYLDHNLDIEVIHA